MAKVQDSTSIGSADAARIVAAWECLHCYHLNSEATSAKCRVCGFDQPLSADGTTALSTIVMERIGDTHWQQAAVGIPWTVLESGLTLKAPETPFLFRPSHQQHNSADQANHHHPDILKLSNSGTFSSSDSESVVSSETSQLRPQPESKLSAEAPEYFPPTPVVYYYVPVYAYPAPPFYGS